MDISLIADNLLSPPILFFFLGLLGTIVGSDLDVPRAVTRGLSLYLLVAIGLHGGVELRSSALDFASLAPLGAGVVASALLPVTTFFLLRRRLPAVDAAAIGATYGSISAVTFITATSFLDDRGLAWSGSMVAAMALMESPAILVAVLLARYADRAKGDEGTNGGAPLEALVREVFVGAPVFLLCGALVIGVFVGEKGWGTVAPFLHEPFKGALCLFLLDMGLVAGRRLGVLRESGLLLFGFAIGAPLVHAAGAIALAAVLGLTPGNALLFTVLCASASYIAVPAAMRTALPRANPSLYLPMSLAVTFPFNIALGIPLYMSIIDSVWSKT